MKSTQRPPETCPVCGEEVPSNAVACKVCGADHDSGWKEDSGSYDGVNLPDEDFDYEGFIRDEFGTGKPAPSGMKVVWWLTALLVLIAFLMLFVPRG